MAKTIEQLEGDVTQLRKAVERLVEALVWWTAASAVSPISLREAQAILQLLETPLTKAKGKRR